MTVIVVLYSSGYCRIGSLNPACAPIRKISRLTTVASTGLLMKMSVKRMGLLLGKLRRRLQRARIVDFDGGAGLQLELAARDHLLAVLDALEDGGPVALRRPYPHEAALHRELGRGRNGAGRSGIGGLGRGYRLARGGWRRGCSGLRRAGFHHPDAIAIKTVGHRRARHRDVFLLAA